MPIRLVTRVRLVLCGLVLAVFAAGLASAQNINFNLFGTSNGQSYNLPNDQAVTFSTTVGTQQVLTVKATYTGNTQATIVQLPQMSGSTEFTEMSGVTLGEMFTPGQSFTFTITYSPTNSSQAEAEFSVLYTEPTGPGGAAAENGILLPLIGTAPNFVLFYVLQSNGNAVPISSGETIPFGNVQINTTSEANLDILNTGSGTGYIIGITGPPTGSPFMLDNLPLATPQTPFGVASGMEEPLLIEYTPTAAQTDKAQIVITYLGGATATVNLQGTGITSTFTYTYVVQGVSTTVENNGTITFLGANVGSTSGLIVQAKNTGTASGTISSVGTQGPFTLTNPVVTPATLTPGESFSVPLTFTPTQVGSQTGELAIGNAFFILKGSGLGSNLTYSYKSNGSTTTVNPATGGEVFFNPIAVGQSESITFTIANSGTLPATVSLIGTSPSNGPFSVSPPALPTVLAAGKTLSFPVTFTPTINGISTGSSLVVNSTSIPLAGNATVPATLPSYTITGPSGSVQPSTSYNVGLTLSKGYSLDLTGTLTITTEGSFGSDPAVQFATGSAAGNRVVDFTIPANTTAADFAGQGSEIPLQTGTVAETVTLTPTFTTTGGLSVTPAAPPTLQFSIPAEAPVLVNAQVVNETANSFELVVTGYSTTRSLNSLNVTFTPATGFNIQTTTTSIPLGQASTAWFGSETSAQYGGLFSITMPFVLQGTVPKGDTLIQTVATVTATVSNSVGTSGSQAASVQ
jgi:hypothetical protein